MTDIVKYDFWLKFGWTGGKTGPVPVVTKAEPQLARGERAARCTIELPISLFKTPSLTIAVAVPENETPELGTKVTAAVDAFKKTLGLDIDLKFVGPENGQ